MVEMSIVLIVKNKKIDVSVKTFFSCSLEKSVDSLNDTTGVMKFGGSERWCVFDLLLQHRC